MNVLNAAVMARLDDNTVSSKQKAIAATGHTNMSKRSQGPTGPNARDYPHSSSPLVIIDVRDGDEQEVTLDDWAHKTQAAASQSDDGTFAPALDREDEQLELWSPQGLQPVAEDLGIAWENNCAKPRHTNTWNLHAPATKTSGDANRVALRFWKAKAHQSSRLLAKETPIVDLKNHTADSDGVFAKYTEPSTAPIRQPIQPLPFTPIER